MPSSPIAPSTLRVLVRERGGPRREGLVLEGGDLLRRALDEREADIVIEVDGWDMALAEALREGRVRILRGAEVLMANAKVLKRLGVALSRG